MTKAEVKATVLALVEKSGLDRMGQIGAVQEVLAEVKRKLQDEHPPELKDWRAGRQPIPKPSQRK